MSRRRKNDLRRVDEREALNMITAGFSNCVWIRLHSATALYLRLDLRTALIWIRKSLAT
jgi:hypothetical protein